MEAAASSHSSTDGTLGSEPHCLNFLKQSLLGYWDFNVACRAGVYYPCPDGEKESWDMSSIEMMEETW